MDPTTALQRYGGAASRAQLLELTTRAELELQLAGGAVVKDARGRYSLPDSSEALRAANSVTGVVSHLSAARRWGWEVKLVPDKPHITVPRNRNVSQSQRELVVPHWGHVAKADIKDLVTSKRRTLRDCVQSLPFDEGLAVADSALRHGDVTRDELDEVAAGIRGPGGPKARAVARHADGRAANPFESVLRAIGLYVSGIDLTPQVDIADGSFFARPDLVDVAAGLVVEAESHTWHSSREALQRDCRRYNELNLRGWLVLRFTWEDVMGRPGDARRVLTEGAALLAAKRAGSVFQPRKVA